MLDFEPEQPPVQLHSWGSENGGYAGQNGHAENGHGGARTLEDGGECVLMSPAVIDSIGFALSLRASHSLSRDSAAEGQERHALKLLATAEDDAISGDFLNAMLHALRR